MSRKKRKQPKKVVSHSSWFTFSNECGLHWDARPGEVVVYSRDDGSTYETPAMGPHHCIKDAGHVLDPTNDDHRCCCGNTTWVTRPTQ